MICWKYPEIPHYNCRWKDAQEIKSSARKVSHPSTIPALSSLVNCTRITSLVFLSCMRRLANDTPNHFIWNAYIPLSFVLTGNSIPNNILLHFWVLTQKTTEMQCLQQETEFVVATLSRLSFWQAPVTDHKDVEWTVTCLTKALQIRKPHTYFNQCGCFRGIFFQFQVSDSQSPTNWMNSFGWHIPTRIRKPSSKNQI